MSTRTERAALRLRGAMTAIVTPFDERGAVDLAAFEKIARWQVEQGIDGLVPCGTTGEGATLDEAEQREVIATAVRAADGRVPVIAGCGSNDTQRTIRAGRNAAEVGADALLIVSPYYNKPNRTGMIAHYERVAEATGCPIVVYNVPGRTGQNLGAELILELARIPGVVAVKEAAGDLDQMGAILERRPDGFAVLSGDDSLTLSAMALGADGVISVLSNEAPSETAALVAAGLDNDFRRARELHYRLLPLMRANFVESNPVPVKQAMELLGHCSGRVRLPLGPASPATVETLRRALAACDLGRGAA